MSLFTNDIIPLSFLYYETGRTFYYQKNYAESLQYFLKALDKFNIADKNISLSTIHYALAKTYHELQLDKESLENYFIAFENDIQHNPEPIIEAQQILNESNVQQEYKFLQEWNSKLNSLNISAQAKQELHLLQGRIYMLNKKPEDNELAEAEFNAVLKENPDHLYALENLGEIYRRTGRFQQALDVFEKVAKSDVSADRKDFISLRKALLFLDKGNYEEVLQYTSELSLPQAFYKTLIYKLRAKSFLYTNEPAKAIEEADKVMLSDNTNFEAILIKAIALVHSGQYENALFTLNKSVVEKSTNEEYLFCKAKILTEGLIDLEESKKIVQGLTPVFLSKKMVEEVQLLQEENGNAHLFLAVLQNISSNAYSALDSVQAAFKAGIKGTNKYPELYAYQVRGDILEQNDEKEVAGKAYFEAAKRLYWETNYKEATKFFEKAIGNNDHDENIFWNSADNYLMQSATTTFPFSSEEILANAENHWKKGIAVKHPGIEDQWCYITKARIHEFRFSHTATADAEEHRKALYYAMQSIFFKQDDYFNLAFVGHYLRFLGFNLNALEILEKSEKKKNDFALAKEEKAAVFLNLGRWDEALAYLNELDNNEENTAYYSWRGYLHFNKAEYNSALVYFTKAIEQTPEDAWSRLMRIQTRWHLANIEGDMHYDNLLKDATWLYERKDDRQYIKEQSSIAFAAMFAEKDFTKTEQFFSKLSADDDNKFLVNLNLSYFYLMNGKIEQATKQFNKYLPYHTNERELIAIKRDIKLIASDGAAKNPELGKAYAQIIDENSEDSWITKINESIDHLHKNPPTCIQEIERELKENNNYSYGTVGWKALQLRLAQLKSAEKCYREAIEIYTTLLPSNKEEIFSVENLCIKLEAPAAMQEYWILKDFLAEKTAGALSLSEDVHRFYEELKGRIRMPFSEEYQLDKAIDFYPVVTPLALEVCSSLVPADTNEWPLIKERFPKLREEILSRYGVAIPGVRVRENDYDLPQDSYVIMLNEIPLALSYLFKDFCFCPSLNEKKLQELGILAADYTKASIRFTLLPGEDSFWIKNQHSITLEKNAIEFYYDHFEFAVAHLRKTIMQNLPEFLNLQHTEDNLDKWEKEAIMPDKINTLFPKDDVKRKIQFTRLLKMLLAEGVPITNTQAILSVLEINDLESNELTNTYCRLRETLKEQLPGNLSGLKKVKIPAEIELKIASFVTEQQGRICLAIPPADTQELLADFKEFYKQQEDVSVVLVADTFLRLPVKKLLEIEYPELIFLAEKEIISAGKMESIRLNTEENNKQFESRSFVQEDKKICPNPSCGKVIDAKWKVCIFCGINLTDTLSEDRTEQSKSFAGKAFEDLSSFNSRSDDSGKKPYELPAAERNAKPKDNT